MYLSLVKMKEMKEKRVRTSESNNATAIWEDFLCSLCLTVHFLEVFFWCQRYVAWMQMRCQIQRRHGGFVWGRKHLQPACDSHCRSSVMVKTDALTLCKNSHITHLPSQISSLVTPPHTHIHTQISLYFYFCEDFRRHTHRHTHTPQQKDAGEGSRHQNQHVYVSQPDSGGYHNMKDEK